MLKLQLKLVIILNLPEQCIEGKIISLIIVKGIGGNHLEHGKA